LAGLNLVVGENTNNGENRYCKPIFYSTGDKPKGDHFLPEIFFPECVQSPLSRSLLMYNSFIIKKNLL